MGVLLPLLLVSELQPARQVLEDLKKQHLEGRWKKAPAFYQEFAAGIKLATDYVDIAYMAAYPPLETADEERRRYYAELPGLIRRRKEINFRRVVRDSKRNRAWIVQMLNEMKNSRNFALAVVKDDEAYEDSLVMSVQIIDGDSTWLVALESHEPKGGHRDLFLKGRIVAEGLRTYYDRVWGRGDILMKNGNLTPAGEAYLATSTASSPANA
jgi:hypothetical protein